METPEEAAQAGLSRTLSRLEGSLTTKKQLVNAALFQLAARKLSNQALIEKTVSNLNKIVADLGIKMERELEEVVKLKREHIKKIEGNVVTKLEEILDLSSKLAEDNNSDLIRSKAQRLELQIEQGLFNLDPDFSKMDLVIQEPLAQLLDRRYEQFFGFSNLPEPLKLRIVRASGSEIRLELQACSKTMFGHLWHDLHISVTCQDEAIFGPSSLESLFEQNLARIAKTGLVKVAINFDSQIKHLDVLVHVTRGLVHINGSPQAVALVEQSLPDLVLKEAHLLEVLKQSPVSRGVGDFRQNKSDLESIAEDPESQSGKTPFEEICSANSILISKDQLDSTTNLDQTLILAQENWNIESEMKKRMAVAQKAVLEEQRKLGKRIKHRDPKETVDRVSSFDVTLVDDDPLLNVTPTNDSYVEDELVKNLLKTGSRTLVEEGQARLTGSLNDVYDSYFLDPELHRNVLFSRNSVVLEVETVDGSGETDYQEFVNVRTEETKLEDGQTTISKFLNEGEDNSSMTDISKFYEEIHGQDQNLGDCWDDTPETWDAKCVDNFGKNPPPKTDISGPTWDDPDYSKLAEQQKRGVPEFDLASSCVSLLYVKSLDFDIGVSAEKDVLIVPQGVARDPYLDRTYISDITGNNIRYYDGWTYKGIWQIGHSFRRPRYVMTLPNIPNPEKDRKKGMDVVVLDNLGLHLFKSNGELRRTFFVGTGFKYRGLAYDKRIGWIITTTKVESQGVYLVFFNLRGQPDAIDGKTESIDKMVLLTPTSLSDFTLKKTMCRFVATTDKCIYTSDMGLGCLYVTDCRTDKTVAVSFPKNTKNVLGIVVDPAGNVLVSASDRHGKYELQVLSEQMELLRTLTDLGFDLLSVVDIEFDGRQLFLSDVETKAVHVFVVQERSPKKRTEDISRQITIPIDL